MLFANLWVYIAAARLRVLRLAGCRRHSEASEYPAGPCSSWRAARSESRCCPRADKDHVSKPVDRCDQVFRHRRKRGGRQASAVPGLAYVVVQRKLDLTEESSSGTVDRNVLT